MKLDLLLLLDRHSYPRLEQYYMAPSRLLSLVYVAIIRSRTFSGSLTPRSILCRTPLHTATVFRRDELHTAAICGGIIAVGLLGLVDRFLGRHHLARKDTAIGTEVTNEIPYCK